MKPPICRFCHQRFAPGKTSGGLVYFKESAEDQAYNQRLKEQKKIGHPKGRDWFCEDHIDWARSLKHLTLKEAIQEMKES